VRDGERIVGMVNLSDLFRSAGVSPADAATSGPWHRYEHMMSTSKVGRTVADAMTTDVVMLPPDALIAEAAAVMRHHGVNRIPVVDADGVLLGIVARDDVIAAVAEAARPRGQPQPRPGATRIPPD
jgi:CBS domain-containing protein